MEAGEEVFNLRSSKAHGPYISQKHVDIVNFSIDYYSHYEDCCTHYICIFVMLKMFYLLSNYVIEGGCLVSASQPRNPSEEPVNVFKMHTASEDRMENKINIRYKYFHLGGGISIL